MDRDSKLPQAVLMSVVVVPLAPLTPSLPPPQPNSADETSAARPSRISVRFIFIPRLKKLHCKPERDTEPENTSPNFALAIKKHWTYCLPHPVVYLSRYTYFTPK